MKCLKYLIPVLIASFLGLGHPLIAQPLQKHNNSVRLQFGLFQYNENNSDFITQNNNDILSTGLTYRREMSRIFALNVTGRYIEWDMNKSLNLQTYAFQALWLAHTYSISSSWRANRISPYAGVGVGYENHRLTTFGNDTLYHKLYIPFEVGVLFNMSPRWSIGLFAEYKLASVSPIKNTFESPKVRLDLVNTAGISLSYSFGTNKKEQSVPVIRTNQAFLQMRVLDKDAADSTIVWNDSELVDDLLRSDSVDKSKLFSPSIHDSTAIRESSEVLFRKTEFIADTIRVPVILDININTLNNITDSNNTVLHAARMQQPDKGAVTSPTPLYDKAANEQIKGQLGQIDKNISALQAQIRRQNSSIESELKSMKVMIGVLNAEILLLTAVKSKAPKEEKKSENLPPTTIVDMDSLTYLIQEINSQSGTDSISLSLANANVSLLEELNKLQSENKALTDKLDSISRVEPTPVQVPYLPDDVVHTITFAVNSTKVDAVQLIQLKSMLDLLKSKPDYKLLLSGFTDKSGNANYNMALSKNRVKAVKNELIKMGVNKVRVIEEYFGSEKASALHNENDRKVELKVLK